MTAEQPPLPLDVGLGSAQAVIDSMCATVAGSAQDDRKRRILFTSPASDTGTTTLATATATGLARSLGEKVILIEANNHSPDLSSYLAMDPSPGISDVLAKEAKIETAVRNSLVPGLHVLTAGSGDHAEAPSLASQEAQALLRSVIEDHSFAIIDAPPILEYPADVRNLLRHATEAVLVIRASRTSRSDAQEALRHLSEAGVNVMGVVVNRFENDLPFGVGAQRS